MIIQTLQATAGHQPQPVTSHSQSPAMAGPTVTRDGAEFKPKLHGRCKKSADAEPHLQSQPLTEEAFKKMVPVREKKGILGAVALLMAMAATAMGLFNRAQIENLCSELFQNRKATRHLFQVVQDFSQNFVGLQNSFYKLRGMLLQLILANPTLLDARLSWIENQLRD
jgi:hypothetical protein